MRREALRMCLPTEGGEILSANRAMETSGLTILDFSVTSTGKAATIGAFCICRVLSTTPGFVVNPPTSVLVLQDISDRNDTALAGWLCSTHSAMTPSPINSQQAIFAGIEHDCSTNATPELPATNNAAISMLTSLICLTIPSIFLAVVSLQHTCHPQGSGFERKRRLVINFAKQGGYVCQP